MPHVLPGRRSVLRVLVVALLLGAGVPADGQQDTRRQFTLRGRVEKVDVASGSVRVNHEAVEGLMAGMIMDFDVRPVEVLAQLKAGDRIVATLYEGDTRTLHNVRIDAAAAAAATDELPPISYVCPTPGEETVLEDTPGQCPGSGAPLVPVRLVTAYSCLRVQVVIREAPGVCPVDRSPLVPITAAMHFSCQNDSRVYEMEPGTCSDGQPRVKRFERRAHGDHNPRHGGPYVAMSADQWHHLEGTWVEPGIFRVYFYDDMTRPLRAAGFSGTLALTDENAQEIGPRIPLVDAKSADGSVLEASVGSRPLPVRLKLHMQFKPGEPPQIFDFTFQDWSREP